MVEKFLENIRREEQNFLKAPIYLYGTEAIGAYYSNLDLEDKSVLVVNGSGDQVLNAYYFGAKKVVGFDIVANTRYILDLKIVAIQKLSRLEFLVFFGDTKDLGDFNYETYKLLKNELSKETDDFFEELFEKYDYDGAKLLRSGDFRKRKEFYEKLFVINPFLANDENYEKMKQLVSEITLEFVESDIYEVHNKIKDKFDLINLSNVLNYISKDLVKRGVENPLEEMYEKILMNLGNMLNSSGKIIFYSFYRRLEEVDDIPLINQEKSFEWIKNRREFNIYKIGFNGILFGTDEVTVLEKG